MAVDADVETKLNELKAPYTQEGVPKTASGQEADARRPSGCSSGASSASTSYSIKRSLAHQYQRRRCGQFLQPEQVQFNLVEPRVHMAQIQVNAIS
jgi:hypothetical protein